MKTLKNKVLFFITLTTFTTLASADPRLDPSNNLCHFPLSATDAGDEVVQNGCSPHVVIVHGRARGFGFYKSRVPYDTAPESIRLSSQVSNIPCVLKGKDGKEYVSYKWRSKVISREGAKHQQESNDNQERGHEDRHGYDFEDNDDEAPETLVVMKLACFGGDMQ